MDFVKNLTKSGESKPAEPKPADQPNVFTTAKGTAAGAAADAVGAVSDFAKLDKTQGVGKQAEQTEAYLREVNTASKTAPK